MGLFFILHKLGMNAVGETIATYEYDEIGRLKTKRFYPDRQYQQASTPDYINRPPDPSSNTEDIAAKAVFLNPGTSIDAVTLNTYVASIGQGNSNVIVQGLQTINLAYHIRGMLNCVNCTNNQPALDASQNDFFANKLEFETYGWYDGNIGKETWTSKANLGTNRSYTHNYDPAKRVTSSIYAGGMYSNENFSFSIGSYDKNGNIKIINRSGATALSDGLPTAFGPVDQMTYSYTGNRLTGIIDSINGNEDVGDFRDNGSNSDYTYWNDGSLKSDANKQISIISYDSYLNKPKEINYTDGRWIRFYYNGKGTKIKQANSNGEEFHYTNKSIFKLKESVTSLYQISQEEGRVVPKDGGGFSYEFNYSDHLGNLRLSFKESDGSPNNGVYPAPIVIQENSYFPFGLEHRGIDNVSSKQNLFQYNGKEKIDMFNLGWSDYGFRSMDLQTARFISSDPLSTKFPELTNYQYASNRPIDGVDLEGLEYSKSPAMYDPMTGRNKVTISLRVNPSNDSKLISNEKYSSALSSIQNQFNSSIGAVYDKQTNTQYSGNLIYDDNATISLVLSDPPQGDNMIAALSGPGVSIVNVAKYENGGFNMKSDKNIAVNSVHELLHQGGVGHPTDTGQNIDDVKLTRVPGEINSFKTTSTTDVPDIYHNIMLYSLYTVNGKNVGKVRGSNENATKVSPGQVKVIEDNINKGKVNGEPMND